MVFELISDTYFEFTKLWNHSSFIRVKHSNYSYSFISTSPAMYHANTGQPIFFGSVWKFSAGLGHHDGYTVGPNAKLRLSVFPNVTTTKFSIEALNQQPYDYQPALYQLSNVSATIFQDHRQKCFSFSAKSFSIVDTSLHCICWW